MYCCIIPSQWLLFCQIVPELLMKEMVAAAYPLEDLALVHGIQPRGEAQGELFFLPKAEAEEVMLEYLIGAEDNKTINCC